MPTAGVHAGVSARAGSGGLGATETAVCPVGVTVSTACRPSTSVTVCDHPGACFA